MHTTTTAAAGNGIGAAFRRFAMSLALLSVVVGCQARSSRDFNQLTAGQLNDRGSQLERRASGLSYPESRASTFLDAAEAYLANHRAHDAKRCVNSARQAYYAGPIAGRANRLLGSVYLETGEVTLAERYLLKGIDDSKGTDRDIAWAKLTLCAESRGDGIAAKNYRARIQNGNNVEVLQVLTRKIVAKTHPTNLSYTKAMQRRQAPPKTAKKKPTRGVSVASVNPRSRSQWSANPVISSRVRNMGKISRITVHHTAGPSFWGHSHNDVAQHLRSIQRTHQKQRRWADVGYHWFIDRAGHVWQGRSMRHQGAHVSENNPGNVGIALLGNYDRQQLTAAQKSALYSLVAQLAKGYRVRPENIHTHGEIAPNHTQCPGRAVTSVVNTIRRDLKVHQQVALGK